MKTLTIALALSFCGISAAAALNCRGRGIQATWTVTVNSDFESAQVYKDGAAEFDRLPCDLLAEDPGLPFLMCEIHKEADKVIVAQFTHHSHAPTTGLLGRLHDGDKYDILAKLYCEEGN